MDNAPYENKNIPAIIEAILFASDKPVAISALAQAIGMDNSAMRQTLSSIITQYNGSDGGLMITVADDICRLCTKEQYHDYIESALQKKSNSPLSNAALEALAIIAYNQPVTRMIIEQIRGVDCVGVVTGLCDRGLIEQCGNLDAPGRPALYRTTNNFLQTLGIESLDMLPELNKSKKTDANDTELKQDGER